MRDGGADRLCGGPNPKRCVPLHPHPPQSTTWRISKALGNLSTAHADSTPEPVPDPVWRASDFRRFLPLPSPLPLGEGAHATRLEQVMCFMDPMHARKRKE